ncbi:putative reverse transcriptase domain-containing protein [Tanacetum coccineum]|uniref:Reverse transcriptase domain-containing protein n=1 Tax=Tanacetum coccineum TaxID=301880 RepID=A0ABQ4WGA0_9ASTR
MFPGESYEVEKYVDGLPDMIQESVMASKPKTMQDAIKFATELMDQKICTFADRQAENKRKVDDNSRSNQNQQQPFKRKNMARAYTTGPREKKRSGLLAHDCRSPAAAANKSPHGESEGNSRATARAYAVRNTRKNSYANFVTGMFLLNNRYASILFDISADRSFVSTAFSSLIDIALTTLDHDYDVELADGKIIRVNTIIRVCTLNFLNHPFNIDLMPVELGSVDVIIGMDCNNGNESRLNIISCTKTQKYLLKGCHVFLAYVTTKKAKDKSEEKRLEDVPIVRDFPEVFPEDLSARAPYRLAPSEMKELFDQLQELFDKGFKRPSSSPWGALVLFVKKKDGSFWMCIDYRELNKLTVKNRYPLPRIDDLFDQLQGSSVYSKIDLRSGYHQLRVPEEDILSELVTAIMNFKLCHLNKQEHEEQLKLILELLKKEELYAKFSKCKLLIPKVQFLGHVIDSKGIHMDPAKIESIKD